MEVRGDLAEVNARWRKLAEATAQLLAGAKQLDDTQVMAVVELLKQSAPLLLDIIGAADADLADDADKLGLLTSLKDPDVRKALDTAGPHLAKTALFLDLKGYPLKRAQVRDVIADAERHLSRLSRITIRVLKAAEKQLRQAKKQPQVESRAFTDRYQNLQRIAEGVDGEVFSADDVALKRRVAIKFSRKSAPGHNNIVDHARALARVKHPNVVTVYDVCPVQDPTSNTAAQAVVMELIEGTTLTERIGYVMNADEIARIGFAILDAISEYHANGLAHMDLHDGNIVVGPKEVKVIDAVYRPTAAFASTAARVQQQGRDVRDARDHLIQMLHHSTVPLAAAHRFGQETTNPTIDLLRQKLKEALGSAAEPEQAERSAEPLRKVPRMEPPNEPAPTRVPASNVEQPWLARRAQAASIRSRLLGEALVDAADAAEQGDLQSSCAIIAGCFEALRIHVQRFYRKARGSDAPEVEDYLPAVLSPAAAFVFPQYPKLCFEPKLAEDKYGEAALASAGFTMSALALFQRLVGATNPLTSRREEAPLNEAELLEAHERLAERILAFEQTDRAVLEAFDAYELVEVTPPETPDQPLIPKSIDELLVILANFGDDNSRGHASLDREQLARIAPAPAQELADMLKRLESRGLVRVAWTLGNVLPLDTQLTHHGREAAHRLGASVVSPVEDANALLGQMVASGQTRSEMSCGELGKLLGWPEARATDAARVLHDQGRGRVRQRLGPDGVRFELTAEGRASISKQG